MASILVVDDEPGVRSSVSGVLSDEGFDVDTAGTGEECLERANNSAYDVIVLDIWLPGLDGLTTLQRLRERQIDSQVVIISGHGNIESAVRAIKMGAYDFVEKPLSLEKTVLVVRNALRQRDLEAENRVLRAKVDRQSATMVGESPAMAYLRQQVALAAPTNGRVLILGDNGTGKELVARTIHQNSRRKSGPFIEVNCAAIPDELIESELFGHVRGAFTGAVADKPGRFEQANTGTIFLDEIADMSLKTQAKVLRVLQEQVMERVGGTQRIKVDVRVLAATNKDLLSEIRARPLPGGLVLPVERDPDLRAAVARSAAGHPAARRAFHGVARGRIRPPPEAAGARSGGAAPAVRVAGQRARAAQRDRAADHHGGRRHDHRAGPRLPRARRRRGVPEPAAEAGAAACRSRKRAIEFEKDYILQTLAAQGGNMSRTAEVLGVERSNLYKKLRAFGITPRGN